MKLQRAVRTLMTGRVAVIMITRVLSTMSAVQNTHQAAAVSTLKACIARAMLPLPRLLALLALLAALAALATCTTRGFRMRTRGRTGRARLRLRQLHPLARTRPSPQHLPRRLPVLLESAAMAGAEAVTVTVRAVLRHCPRRCLPRHRERLCQRARLSRQTSTCAQHCWPTRLPLRQPCR